MNTRNLLIVTLGIFLLVLTACEKEKIEITETGTITGVVLDSETDQPIKGVTITTNPASSSIITDDNGAFTIEEVETGDVTITAKKSLYTSNSVTVLVKANESTNAVITLQKSAGYYKDVILDNPNPAHEASGLEVNFNISWSVETDQDFDSLRFDVIMYESNSAAQQQIASGISDTSAAVDNLHFNTTYYWQVIALNDDEEVSRSETWSFTTKELPDYPYLYAKKVENSYEIFYSDTSVSSQIQLTYSTSSFDWFPRVNPDRTKIAFTSNRDTDPHIYMMDRDGQNLQKVTSVRPNIGYFNMGEGFCWSPNGQYILYSNYHRLYRIERSGYGLTEVATAPADRNFKAVDWNGVTEKIVAQTVGENIYESEIYLMNTDGSEMELLIDDLPGRIENPSFSINGEKILYTWDVDGLNATTGRQLNAHIFLYDIAADTSMDLSGQKPNGTNDLMPRFSPNGAHIIFVNTSNTGTEPKEIWKMDINGESRELLIEDGQMPDWI